MTNVASWRVGVFIALVATGQVAVAAAVKPNFVVILCDDLGYGDLGCQGHPTIQTPVLDQMARDGIRLTHCYSSAPVCSPSRAGMITGRCPYRAGIKDWIPPNSGIYLAKSEPSVAKLLKSAGYATALVGKWHLNSKMDGSEPTPGDHGFDHWFATQNNAAPSLENPRNFVRNGKAVGPLTGFSSQIIVDEAIAWLETKKAAPFALFVWLHAPHEPVATPAAFRDKYAGAEPTKQTYFGSVSMIDAEVGRLDRRLRDLGVADRTLVFFTSDNGPETLSRYRGSQNSHGSPGPLRGMKLHLYEGGYRVPGILKWPTVIKPGQLSEEAVCNVDVLPTFCELAGVTLPKAIAWDGASFAPLFRGEKIERKTPLYWQYDRAIGGPHRVSLLADPWKVLADAKLERFEFFSIRDDPSEMNPRTPEDPKALEELMRKRHAEINPPAPALKK